MVDLASEEELKEAPSLSPATLPEVNNEAEVEAIDDLIDAPISESVVDYPIETLISELVIDDPINNPISEPTIDAPIVAPINKPDKLTLIDDKPDLQFDNPCDLYAERKLMPMI